MKIHTKTKVSLLVYITHIAVVAYDGNTLERTIAQSRFAIDSQLGDSTIQRYNQKLILKVLVTISLSRGKLFDAMATTAYKLRVPNPKNALIPNDLKKVLKPQYLTIKNGDDSAFTSPNTSGSNNFCHIDLGVISGIWHPHDNRYNTNISGGLAGKLIWNLAQGLLYGSLQDLCNWLDPVGSYFQKTTLERLGRNGLVTKTGETYSWEGDGKDLESIAYLTGIKGKTQSRDSKLHIRREQRVESLLEWRADRGITLRSPSSEPESGLGATGTQI